MVDPGADSCRAVLGTFRGAALTSVNRLALRLGVVRLVVHKLSGLLLHKRIACAKLDKLQIKKKPT